MQLVFGCYGNKVDFFGSERCVGEGHN
jgi:hypothetical protein